MRNFEKRIRRLEAGQVDDFEETLSFLTFLHDIERGPPYGPLTVEVKEKLEKQAKELTAKGIHYSLVKIIREIHETGSRVWPRSHEIN